MGSIPSRLSGGGGGARGEKVVLAKQVVVEPQPTAPSDHHQHEPQAASALEAGGDAATVPGLHTFVKAVQASEESWENCLDSKASLGLGALSLFFLVASFRCTVSSRRLRRPFSASRCSYAQQPSCVLV